MVFVLFDLTVSEKPIFKNRLVLDPDYVPSNLHHRENILHQIEEMLKPLLKGDNPYNIYIYGPPGVGKTTAVKFLFNKLEEAHSEVKAFHFDCWKSTYALLSEIYKAVSPRVPPRSTDEVWNLLVNRLDRIEKDILIALDDVELHLTDANKNSVVWYLLKARSNIEQNLGLILISTEEHALRHLDFKTLSRLKPHSVKFERYTCSQVFDILKERTEYAFRPGAIKNELIHEVADIVTLEGGDIRLGLEILKTCGDIAEREGTEEILHKHVTRAMKEIKLSEIVKLNTTAKIILKAIAEIGKEKLDVRELYDELGDMSNRTIRYWLPSLEKSGFIELDYKKGRGRSREMELLLPTKSLKRVLND